MLVLAVCLVGTAIITAAFALHGVDVMFFFQSDIDIFFSGVE